MSITHISTRRNAGQNELSRTVLAGLTAAKLFDTENPNLEKKTHFQGQPFNLGYAGLGPLILGYMLWLGRNAKKDNISKLYFLAREGWLLKASIRHITFNG
ncbi:hypothetical protein ABR759_00865 [Escherichia coli]